MVSSLRARFTEWRPTLTVHGGLLLTQFIFAGSTVFGKICVEEMPGFIFAQMRNVFSVPMYAIMSLIFYRTVRVPVSFGRLCILAVFGVFLNQPFSAMAYEYTSATTVSIISALMPVFAFILSVCLRYDRLRIIPVVGLAVAVAGVLVTVDFSSKDSSSKGKAIGDLLVLVSTVSYATYIVLQKKFGVNVRALILNTWVFSIGLLLISGPAVYYDRTFSFHSISFKAWMGLLYCGVGSSLCGYFLITYCSKFTTPLVTAVYLALQPVATMLVVWVVQSEAPTWRDLLGGVLIIAGVITVNITRNQTPPSQPTKGASGGGIPSTSAKGHSFSRLHDDGAPGVDCAPDGTTGNDRNDDSPTAGTELTLMSRRAGEPLSVIVSGGVSDSPSAQIADGTVGLGLLSHEPRPPQLPPSNDSSIVTISPYGQSSGSGRILLPFLRSGSASGSGSATSASGFSHPLLQSRRPVPSPGSSPGPLQGPITIPSAFLRTDSRIRVNSRSSMTPTDSHPTMSSVSLSSSSRVAIEDPYDK